MKVSGSFSESDAESVGRPLIEPAECFRCLTGGLDVSLGSGSPRLICGLEHIETVDYGAYLQDVVYAAGGQDVRSGARLIHPTTDDPGQAIFAARVRRAVPSSSDRVSEFPAGVDPAPQVLDLRVSEFPAGVNPAPHASNPIYVQ
jgi:hypothetical protein